MYVCMYVYIYIYIYTHTYTQVGPQLSGVTIMAAPGKHPVVSGGKILDAKWMPTAGPRGYIHIQLYTNIYIYIYIYSMLIYQAVYMYIQMH